MTPRRNPGTQLPLLITPQDSASEIDVPEVRALLEALLEGLRNWDGTNTRLSDSPADEQDISGLMAESIEAFAELGIRIEYRTQTPFDAWHDQSS